MLHALVIELDGVLFDLSAARSRARSEIVARRGRTDDRPASDALARAGTLDDVARALIARTGQAADESAIALATLELERALVAAIGAGGATLQPGARELVAAVAPRAPVLVITHLARDVAAPLLALGELESLVTSVVASVEVRSPVPYRSALARLARRRSMRGGRAVALVATIDAARAAQAAGLAAALVASAADDAPVWVPTIATLRDVSPDTLDAMAARAVVAR